MIKLKDGTRVEPGTLTPLGRRVLVFQRMNKKESKIQLVTEDHNDKDLWEMHMEVVRFGKDCPEDTELKVGDKIVMSQYAQMDLAKMIKNTKKEMASFMYVPYDDIIGTE